MQSDGIRRGFHRLGIVVVASALAVSILSLLAAVSLYLFPLQVGPVFGVGVYNEEVLASTKSPDAARIMRNVRRMSEKGASSGEVKEYIRSEGWDVPGLSRAFPDINVYVDVESPQSRVTPAAIVAAWLSAILVIIAAIWYGIMRAVAWIITGFMR